MPFVNIKDENGVERLVYESPQEQERQKQEEQEARLRNPLTSEGFANNLQQLADLVPEPVQDYLEQAGDRLGQNLLNAAATQQAEAGRTLDQIRELPGLGFIPKGYAGSEPLVPLQEPTYEQPNTPSPFTGEPVYKPSGNGTVDFLADMTASVAQFVAISKGLKATGFNPPPIPLFSKQAAALKASPSLGKQALGRFITGAQDQYVTSAFNDYFLEDRYATAGEALLTPAKGTPLEEPLRNLLVAGPDDTARVAQAKSALTGLIGGALLGGTLDAATTPIANLVARSRVRQINAAVDYAKATDEPVTPEAPADAAPAPVAEEPVRITGRKPAEEAELVARVNTLTAEDKLNRMRAAEEELTLAQEEVENVDALYKAVQQQPAEPEAAPVLQPPTVDDVTAGTVATIPVENIAVDPKRFQFKEAGQLTRTGQSGSLSDTDVFNADLANVISVWRDPADNKTYVVNGHNRLARAAKAGRGSINVRFMDAASASEARLKGAMQNIAEGNGTPIDAAKIMRESAMSSEDMVAQGMPKSGAIFAKAAPLAKLPDELFNQVARGDMTIDIGAAIGSSGAEEQVMRDLASAAKRKKWSAAKTAEAASIARFAQVESVDDPNALGLPGFDQLLSSDFSKQLEVRVAIRGQLRAEINALSAAASTKKAGYLEQAGNVIDVEASGAARASAQQGEAVFNRLANMSGPLSDLITELAAEVKGNKRATTVVGENLQRVRAALEGEASPAPAPAPTPAARPEVDVEKLRRSLQHLSQEEFDAVVEKLRSAGGQITGNPSQINEPTIEQPLPTPEPAPAPAPAAVPQAPPTVPFKYGSPRYRNTKLQWESDIDALIYSVTVKKGRPSKNREKFLAYLQGELGLHESTIAEAGARIRAGLGEKVGDADEYLVPDSGAWRDGGQLAELPPINNVRYSFGRLGEEYTGPTVLGAQERAALLDEIAKVAGPDVNVELVPRIQGRMTPGQARAYGRPEGYEFSASGMFTKGADPAEDVIYVAMFHKSNPLKFVRKLYSAYHEAFHRLQDRFMSRQEFEVLGAAENEVRQLAARVSPEHKDALLSGQIGRKEAEAIAFGGWWQYRGEYGTATWAEPFEKLAQIAEAAGNWLKGRGYQKWDDVFERAYQGEMAERVPRQFADREPQLAVEPPDPDDVARRINENMDALASGDVSVEDLLQDDVRRYASRSGKTRYIELSGDEMAAAFNGVRRTLTGSVDRAELTGRPSFGEEQINGKAIEVLAETGGDLDRLLELAERASKGDLAAGEDLASIRATQILLDDANEKAALAAIEYSGAVGADARASAASKLVAATNDALRLGAAYARMTRVAAQQLRIAQMKADPNMLNAKLLEGVNLQHPTTKETGEAAVRDGLQPAQGALGDGVYFTTDTANYEGMPGYGGALVEGGLQRDVKILDLPSMDKSLADLIRELDLGRMRKGANGLELTPEQKTGLQDYVTGLGYQGLRHETEMIGRSGGPTDEVVVYDVNAANRIVGSKAEVAPPAASKATAADEFAEEVSAAGNLLDRVLPAEVVASIKTGRPTGDAKEYVDLLADVAIQARADKKYAASMAQFMREAPTGSGIARNIQQWHVMSILSAPRTWWTMLFGSAYRAATLPGQMAAGGLMDAAARGLRGDMPGMQGALQGSSLSLKTYMKYGQNLMYALRLTGASLKHNEAFGNLGVDYIGFDRFRDAGPKQGTLRDVQMQEIDDGHWSMDVNNKNFLAVATHYIARAARATVGRPITAIDSFVNGMVGPSVEWARLMDEQLDHAARVGVGSPGSKEVWDHASKETEKLLRRQMRDVTLPSGAVVKGGALTGTHAKNVMDYVAFTDPLKSTYEPRTYQMGIRKAREQGLTDPVDVDKFAYSYMKESPDGRPLATRLWRPAEMASNFVRENPLGSIIYALPRGPVNVLKGAMRMVPGANLLVDTFWRDIHSEDKFTRYRALGEMATGSMTFAIITQLLNSGYIQVTGFDPADWRERKTGPTADFTGYMPTSIRFRVPFTDQYTPLIQVRALDGLATMIGIVGEYKELVENVSYEDAETAASQVAVSIAGVARSLGPGKFNSTVLEPFRRLMDLYSNAMDNGRAGSREGRVNAWTRYIATNLRAFMPSFFAGMRVGPQLLPSGPATEFAPLAIPAQTMQLMRMRLPGASAEFPPERHPITGNPVPMPQALGTNLIPADQPWARSAFNLLSPTSAFVTRTLSDDPIDIEIRKLYGKGSMAQWWTDTTFGDKLPNRVLSPQELDRLVVIGTKEVKIRGKHLEDAMRDLVTKDPKYASLGYGGNPADRSRPSGQFESLRMAEVRSLFREYVTAAKTLLVEESPALAEELRQVEQIRADNAVIRNKGQLDLLREAGSSTQTFVDALN